MKEEFPKSRRRILDAFRSQVLTRPYDEITVAELVAEAGIARSTFYEHFASKKVLLVASLAPLLDVLSDCAQGRASDGAIDEFVAHCWENRMYGRIVFGSDGFKAACDELADSIAKGCGISILDATAYAHAYLGTLYRWLLGEIRAEPKEFAEWLQHYRPLGSNQVESRAGA